MIPQK